MGEQALVAVAAGIAGLAFGSFANVVVYRVPKRESLVRPGSHCPSCSHAVAPRDNIPLLSWLLLRGRCRHCRAAIPWRYPAIEVLTGALFALAALRLPDPTLARHTRWDLLPFLPLMLVLVVLSFIDLEHKILPNRIVLPATAVEVALIGAAALAGPGGGAWVRAVAGGAAGFLVFLALALISPRGMGMGDVKMSALLGLCLGYLGWPRLFVGFMLAFVIGALGGITLMLVGRGGMKTQVPFGPYLALGTVLSVLWGGPLVDAWLGRL